METWRKELYHSELYHHGIKGMRWGVRRYQNPDGTLTPSGRRRYSREEKKAMKTYNYRDSDEYRNSSRQKKATMTQVYNKRKRLLGERTANKIEYRSRVGGEDADKLTKREAIKQAAVSTAIITGVYFVPALISVGKERMRANTAMGINMADIYAQNKGLNVVQKKGFGFRAGLRAAQVGKRAYRQLLRAGKI